MGRKRRGGQRVTQAIKSLGCSASESVWIIFAGHTSPFTVSIRHSMKFRIHTRIKLIGQMNECKRPAESSRGGGGGGGRGEWASDP